MLAASIGNARAATITFDDLPLDVQGTGGDRDSGGFHFDTAANHSHILKADSGVDNGTQYMGIDDVGGLAPDPVTMSQIGGAPFSLTSMDIADWDFGSGHPATQIVLTAQRFGVCCPDSNLIILTLDNIKGFQTFTFGPEIFGSLASLKIQGIGSSANYFAIDNIVVGPAIHPLPEPGTLSLLGLGSAYVFGRRRRNRR